jgi:small GTP-binding protein
VPNRLLNDTTDRQLTAARRLLSDLQAELAAVPATSADSATLAGAIRQLDELFLLVIVGEFNSGKSAFINALIDQDGGDRLLDEGVTPTTAQVHLIRYGAERSVETSSTGIRIVSAPVEFLKDIHIVDTPGTNAIIREHERLTTEFVPNADFVLFVTSADRPFTESERAFVDAIRAWGKKVVVVLNKIDILERPADLEQVMNFVATAAENVLGTRPPIFPVSARLAWRAKHGEPLVWPVSRFEAIERYIHDSLDEAQRFALKVSSPLGVGDVLAQRYLAVANERLSLLSRDREALDDIERQLAQYRGDLARGFELRMNGVEKVLLEMEARGHDYFDDTLRLARVFDLVNRARVQKEFEEKVVADAPQQIDRRVSEIIDWLVDQEYRQWQAVSARLATRQREHEGRILGSGEIGSFHEDRTRLLDSVGREAQRVVDTYDRRRESSRIADGARNAVAATAAISAGALGLGAVVSLAATTAAADITGFVMAGLVATLGLFIIPARRRRARAEIRRKISALTSELRTALGTEFQRAQERSAHRFADAIGPYSRFVRAERDRWEARHVGLNRVRGEASQLLAALRIERAGR